MSEAKCCGGGKFVERVWKVLWEKDIGLWKARLRGQSKIHQVRGELCGQGMGRMSRREGVPEAVVTARDVRKERSSSKKPRRGPGRLGT